MAKEEEVKPDLSPEAFIQDYDAPEQEVTEEPPVPEQEETPAQPEPEAEPEEEEPEAEDSNEDEADEDEISIKDILFKASGYEIEEDLTDDAEGLVKGAEMIAERMFKERLDEFLSSDATIKEFVDYIQKGGDPQKYIKAISPEVNYSTMDITDEKDQKTIIKEYLKTQEYSEEEIKDMLKTYEDSGILAKQAKLNQKALVKQQAKTKEDLIKQQETEKAKQEENASKVWAQIESTLEKDTLAGLPISTKEKKDFKEFIRAVDDKGNSVRMDKYKNLSTEEKLLIDYIVYKGVGNLNKLVGNMATTQNVNKLTSILNKSKGKLSAGQRVENKTTAKPDLSEKAFTYQD